MPTITWTIEQNWVKPVEGSKTDVVVTSTYRCKASETVGTGDSAKTYIATVDGACSFAPPTENFTPYDQLTQDQVLGWCYANGVDQAAIEANVSLQIENQINPPIIAPPLPWLPPVEIVPQVEPPLVNAETPVAAVDEQPVVSDAPTA